MKLRHNPNPGWHRPSVQIDESYANQVRRSTERAERLYAQAQKRLDRAERSLHRARRLPGTRSRQLAELEAVVELRRIELEKYRRLMQSVPQPAINRGTKSFRPVGYGGA